ncbi:hypothetical protein NDU88_000884 [Pleurodeles waltl]|uniref:Uncharacterized protein n=1 Tax=Pleurodeles waltl TaxID=8319 RepID=A0AAV7KZ22_PLEWA|nr:hypothetical protein NDU88_000884 [Pleurodeles waltl]
MRARDPLLARAPRRQRHATSRTGWRCAAVEVYEGRAHTDGPTHCFVFRVRPLACMERGHAAGRAAVLGVRVQHALVRDRAVQLNVFVFSLLAQRVVLSCNIYQHR